MLARLFHPRSVVVVGASRDEQSMSGTLLRNLLDSFRGPLHIVNPKASEVAGRPAMRSVAELPDGIDLAFIAVPFASVLATVDACLAKRVGALVVISAGFAETGAEGRRAEEELQRRCAAAGVPFVGPNCLGVLSLDADWPLNGTFSLAAPPAGDVAVCTQSGALGFVFPDFMRRWGLGLSRLLSLGNKAGVGENDLVALWADDPQVAVIQLYLESFQDPRSFVAAARRAVAKKPVVVLKAGGSGAGQRAAGSHTAALATPAALSAGVLRQAGVLIADELEELFEITALTALQPPPSGRRVAVLTNAGGPGVLCADALAARRLSVPELSETLRAKLRSFLPPQAAVGNPIDLIGSTSPDEYARCLTELLACDEVDSVVVIYVPRLAGTSPAIARAVVEVAARHVEQCESRESEARKSESHERESTKSESGRKTIAAVFMESTGAPPELLDARVRIPAFKFPESAARALAKVSDDVERRRRRAEIASSAVAPSEVAPSEGTASELVVENNESITKTSAATSSRVASSSESGRWLDVVEVHAALAAAGLTAPAWRIVSTIDEALDAARAIGGSLTLKALSPALLHKSRAGGVLNRVRGKTAVADAFFQLSQMAPRVLVQRYIEWGHELLVGVQRDAKFGLVLACGRGGTDVEQRADARFRLWPLDAADQDELASDVAASLPARDADERAAIQATLVELLSATSRLVAAHPALQEADLNPVKLSHVNGAMVVDARLRVSSGGS